MATASSPVCPGLAKTLIVQTVAEILDLDFSRIQFTPDLMPADITGTDIIQEDAGLRPPRTMVFMPGPIFSQIVLADEINRTPPKTQAALLEAMQEHRVTVSGKTYELDQPFFVFATQNPIELEGTYPLPEAQLDRFMFNIIIEHLPEARRDGGGHRHHLEPQSVELESSMVSARRPALFSSASFGAFRSPTACCATRFSSCGEPVRIPPEVSRLRAKSGCSTEPVFERPSSSTLGAKARALMERPPTTSVSRTSRSLAKPVLRHRVMTNFRADSERITTDSLDRPARRRSVPAAQSRA